MEDQGQVAARQFYATVLGGRKVMLVISVCMCVHVSVCACVGVHICICVCGTGRTR